MRKFCLSCRLMANHLNTLSKCKSNSCVSCNDKPEIKLLHIAFVSNSIISLRLLNFQAPTYTRCILPINWLKFTEHPRTLFLKHIFISLLNLQMNAINWLLNHEMVNRIFKIRTKSGWVSQQSTSTSEHFLWTPYIL